MLIEPKYAVRAPSPELEKTQFPGDRSAISGLRYYSPTLGRFINKDPTEEQGGLNLYGFCGNNGISRFDYLGRGIFDFFSNIFRGWGGDGPSVTSSGGVGINVSVGYGSAGGSNSGPVPGRPTLFNPGFAYMHSSQYSIFDKSAWGAPTGSVFDTKTMPDGAQVLYQYSSAVGAWYPIRVVATVTTTTTTSTAPTVTNNNQTPSAPREAPPPDGVVYAPDSHILVDLRSNQIDAHDLAVSQLNQLRTMRTSAHNLLTEAAKIIQQIDASGGLVTLSPGRGLDPFTHPEKTYTGAGTFSVLEYDPFAPEALINLAHELVHGRDFALGTYQSGDFWHMEAYRVQNQIANELGIPMQTQWGDQKDPVIIIDPYRYVDRPDPVNQSPTNRTGGRDGSSVNER